MAFCKSCGLWINENAKFCPGCGVPVSSNPQEIESQGKSNIKPDESPTFFHTSEEIFGKQTPMQASAIIPSPLKYVANALKGLVLGIKGVFKDKKKLIAIIILIAVWLIFTFTQVWGRNSALLNFLTFAKGGGSSSIGGIIGGALGKGIITYFIFSIVLPIFSKGKPLSLLKKVFGSLFSSFNIKGIRQLGFMITGAGLALTAYNFMTGNSSMENSMIGIIAFLLSIKALASGNGFLRGFLTSIAAKITKLQKPDTAFINKMLAGLGAGFAAAIALSAISFAYTSYLVGATGIVAGVVLLIIGSKKTGVTE